jgi:hypothetical protein
VRPADTTYGRALRQSDAKSNGHDNAHCYCNSYGNIDTYGYAYGDINTYTYSYCYSPTDADAQICADAEAALHATPPAVIPH